MKKILISLFLLSIAAFAENNTVETRLGIDFSSKQKYKSIDYENGKYLKKGLELGVEYRRNIGTGFEVGGGVFYKKNGYTDKAKENLHNFRLYYRDPISNEWKDEDAPLSREYKGFHSMPFYLTGRYNFSTPTEFKPYIKMNLGYSINSGTLKSVFSENTSVFRNLKGRLERQIKFKNGSYYAIGTGIEYKNFTVDLSYNVINVKQEKIFLGGYGLNSQGIDTYNDYQIRDTKFKNKFVTLSFGYNFKF
ncbi:MAG: outer membrane beta-barrel protein [Leptotrichiaceae bacterium]|nr:outer membrane beta-barrel protein [Leptotrichiaceae bacterium]